MKLVNLTKTQRATATVPSNPQCRMSFLGAKHVVETAIAEATLEARDLAAILEEVHRLDADLLACRGACYCGA